MNVYMYQADLYCDNCGTVIRATLNAAGTRPADVDDEHTYDSDDYPKGPYADGGGESDTPNHCGECHVFLDNPLTTDGQEYVLDAVADYIGNGRGNSAVIREWVYAYDVTLSDLLDRDGGSK